MREQAVFFYDNFFHLFLIIIWENIKNRLRECQLGKVSSCNFGGAPWDHGVRSRGSPGLPGLPERLRECQLGQVFPCNYGGASGDHGDP